MSSTGSFRRAAAEWFAEGKEATVSLAKFGSLFYVLHEYGIDVTTCIGPSMMPTFNQVGDVVVMERVTPNILRSYRRGDVVIATSPTNPAQTVCKRIRATAGDRVTLPTELSHFGRSQGWAARNGQVVVPEGHVWLEGDNSLNSTDSRYYGPVASALVKGVVLVRVRAALVSVLVVHLLLRRDRRT